MDKPTTTEDYWPGNATSFYARWGAYLAGRTWQDVKDYLDFWLPYPASPEEWRAADETMRDVSARRAPKEA